MTFDELLSLFVIPAKAGIQMPFGLKVRIPAAAGMARVEACRCAF